MNYRVTYIEDKETGTHVYVVQKRKWFVFWEDVCYADNDCDAYKHRRVLMNKEK